jgi:hypothetical protein
VMQNQFVRSGTTTTEAQLSSTEVRAKAEACDSDRQLPVERIVFPVGERAEEKDLAVVHLAKQPPPSVPAAPLLCPEAYDLASKSWWAFGFPGGDRVGELAEGQDIGSVGLGRIQLGRGVGRPVRRGFSGGGVWSPDYRAVVAVVSQVRYGDARAITLHEADQWFPQENILGLSTLSPSTAAGEAALAAWGWSLSRDREKIRHWGPRGRGAAGSASTASVDSGSAAGGPRCARSGTCLTGSSLARGLRTGGCWW